MENLQETFSIKEWAEEDRPREKLLLKGKNALSDAELIAILIGSGSANESAVELSKKILGSVENNLHELGKLSIHDLMKFKGIGTAKAVSIIAALEIDKRRRKKETISRGKIISSNDIYELMHPDMEDLRHEQFWVILLNNSNRVLLRKAVSEGGITGTVADMRIIFKIAIDNLSPKIILCHNHPSGNKQPSEEDIILTKKFKEAGRLMEISVLDHLIVTDNGYFSFADEGMM